MSEFNTSKAFEVTHGDGWSYIINEYDDGLISIAYRDTPDDKPEPRLEGIWPESARAIAAILVELANKIEPKPEALARLIAADPELLEALKAASELIQVLDEMAVDHPEYDPVDDGQYKNNVVELIQTMITKVEKADG